MANTLLTTIALCCTAVMIFSQPIAGADDSPPFAKETFTYKTIEHVEIQLDVYRAPDDVVRPVLVWIHGGALIVGNRESVPSNLLDLCRDEGFALVSIDYRLGPEVKLPQIVEDVQDALRWVRGEGAKLAHLNPERVVVSGGSAGGYLTMMTGICVDPRPSALVAYWGYGDVDGDWYTKPSQHYRTTAPLVGREEAYQGVGRQVLTGTTGDTQKARGRFYLYLRQNGLWTQEITGFDPVTERPKLDPFCPIRNLTADYPPIVMVHGTEDTDVPFEQSAAMDRELSRLGVRHELVTVPGAGHGLSGGDEKLVTEAHQRALDFIREYLQ